jgi:hypothetical protein
MWTETVKDEKCICNWIWVLLLLLYALADTEGRQRHSQHVRNLGARKGIAASTKLRPLYFLETPGKHCTGDWVVLRAGLDRTENLTPTGIQYPNLPVRSDSLYRLSYSGHQNYYYYYYFIFVSACHNIILTPLY